MSESLLIDLALPDEAVAITDLVLPDEPTAEDVQAAAQQAAQAQRRRRLALLEAANLELGGHELRADGPLSPRLLGAARVTVLDATELYDLPQGANPLAAPLSVASERRMCEALRGVLSSLVESIGAVKNTKVRPRPL